ncbi:hypothetical protein DPMN_052381 [Dreissena polymorpha]|uniref:Uncharacterized protein n=1 Tax=Dreissena polymorpha TaxID=45954 RepID=A0A9D4CJL4_DREPO|nr:hypothetical protein DPMN_052381 [Dreissena polymorpha]
MDIQGEFSALKNSLSRVRLTAELKLNESRQGVRRSDQPVLNILKCSRYSETSAKLLATLEPGQPLTQDTLDRLFLISHAQCKYMKDEYAAVLVNSQFDNSTSKLFRALQKNTSGLNAESSSESALWRRFQWIVSSRLPAKPQGRRLFIDVSWIKGRVASLGFQNKCNGLRILEKIFFTNCLF